jgi:two-component system response regulator LytT
MGVYEMKIKVMIAEDERLAREELEYMLSSIDDLSLCPSVTNGKELLDQYEKHLPDVIFLDIQMPELEGMSVAKHLRTKQSSPLIVFTTAYEEYAVEAFGLDAIDYLLKPFSDQRLDEALARVRRELNSHVREDTEKNHPLRQEIRTSEKGAKMSKLLLDDGERFIVIDPKSVYYLMRDDRVVQIHTADNVYPSKLTLQELEEKLSPFDFFRCHRGYLVNLNYIQEIVPWFNGAYNLTLKNKEKTKVPVSRSSAKELLNILQM